MSVQENLRHCTCKAASAVLHQVFANPANRAPPSGSGYVSMGATTTRAEVPSATARANNPRKLLLSPLLSLLLLRLLQWLLRRPLSLQLLLLLLLAGPP